MSTVLNPAAADARPVYEVADVFRQYGAAYREQHSLLLDQQRVMAAIVNCVSSALK